MGFNLRGVFSEAHQKVASNFAPRPIILPHIRHYKAAIFFSDYLSVNINSGIRQVYRILVSRRKLSLLSLTMVRRSFREQEYQPSLNRDLNNLIPSIRARTNACPASSNQEERLLSVSMPTTVERMMNRILAINILSLNSNIN
jgi:hypothetical protein